jgi:hypothetical protein
LIEAAQAVVRDVGRTFASELMGHAVEIQKLLERWDAFCSEMTLTAGTSMSRGLPYGICQDRSALMELPRTLSWLSEEIDMSGSFAPVGGTV